MPKNNALRWLLPCGLTLLLITGQANADESMTINRVIPEEAFEALLGFMQRYPLKRIDVGVAQVNLGWNGHFFPSFRDAFDPYINLRAAARILRACYDAKPGSWIRAAGCYHHPAGGQPAAKYMAIVRRKLNQITPEIKVPDGEPVVLASHSLTWVEPQ
ncbi:hypothetical protein [Citrobacter koseri]|uniref:hypothetical protein n=1 Tax=Citrobacter koseri TaxID=545 RepID=UPI003D0660E6